MDLTSYLLGKKAGGGGGGSTLQTKSVTITENGSTTINPDEGYDGMTKVNLTTNVPAITNSDILITEYNTTTGVIKGQNFGTTGKVYLLNRDTHSYNELSTSNYGASSITLTTPIDRSTIQGNTCFYVQPTGEGISNKFMVYGDGTLTVPQWGLVYVEDETTGQISKITCTSSSDLDKLASSNSQHWGNGIRINGVLIYKSQIVGFQFGEDVTNYNCANYFLSQFTNFNQPLVFTENVSTNTINILSDSRNFDCPIVFTNQTKVGDNFLRNCSAFNQPLDISMFNDLNVGYFANIGPSFNQKIKFPTTLTNTKIGNYFMNGNSGFQKDIELPSNVVEIGNYFFNTNAGYNGKIKFSDTLTTIGTYFLNNCYAFNQPLEFPTGVTSISNYFMSGCSAFNSDLNFKGNVTTIGSYFMQNCSAFNKTLNFLNNVTTIGVTFLNNCSAFNQSIVLNSNIEAISRDFMVGCRAFNKKITIPSNVTSVGINFLKDNYSLAELEVNTTTSPTDTGSLSVQYTATRNYQEGVKLSGTGASTWKTNLPDSSSNPYRKLIVEE